MAVRLSRSALALTRPYTMTWKKHWSARNEVTKNKVVKFDHFKKTSDMKEITKAYKCDYCGRVFSTKSGASKHETHCRKKPSNIACCRCCKHIERKVEEVADLSDEGYPCRKRITIFHCKERGVNLYHPKVERMLEPVKSAIIDGQDAVRMPTIDNPCESREDPDYDLDLGF